MKKIILGLCLFLATNQVTADYKEAIKAYEAGDYKAAMAEFQSLAEIGNINARYNLGMMYLDGLGTKQDLVKAYAWIRLSDEEAKSQDTQNVLKQIEKHFKGDKKQKADSYYSDLQLEFGKDVIVNDLKPIFNKGSGSEVVIVAKPIKTNPPRYPQKALYSNIEGYTRLSFKLGENGSPYDLEVIESYPEGVFDKASLKAVEKWRFEQPEVQSHTFTYKLQFLMGKGYSRKSINAMKEVKIKAQDGDPIAQYFYAKHGASILGDKEINVTELFYQSALKGVADSQHEVGLNLLSGKGCVADKEKGIKWLTKAASANLGRSQYKLSQLYQELEDEGSAEKSKHWLDKAIATKDPEISYKLAKIMDKDGSYQPQAILDMLEESRVHTVSNPLTYFQLLAKNHASLSQYEKAVEFQTLANKMMRRYGKVPQDMQDKLNLYKSKNKS